MTTADASGIGQTGATLSATYSGTSETPREVGFLWGTSASNLTNELYVGMGSGTSGSFSKQLSGLSASTTYFYKAYVIVGTEYYYGAIKSFKTSDSTSPSTGDAEAYAASWLGHYEVPLSNVALSAGQVSHDKVNEIHGSTYAYIYNTSNSAQRIVTHTFSYNSKEVSNYTILYDNDKGCALWAAFEMDKTDHPDMKVGRNDTWRSDPAIPSDWLQLSGSYSDSYTRGHQVASADRQTTEDQNKQTFYYSNMTPQTSTLNNGIWAAHEGKVQGLLTNLGQYEKIYVVTGPVFENGYKYNADGFAVPTKYYKCIMKCTFNSSGTMTAAVGAGYVFEHLSPSRTDTTIDAVETLTGFDFFSNVPDNLETQAEGTAYKFF